MRKLSLSNLEQFLKEQCDTLRSAGLDAAEYKDYLIAMIFLKRVNDTFAIQQSAYLKQLRLEHTDLSPEELQQEIEIPNSHVYEFFVPVLSRWNLHELPAQYREAQEEKLAEASQRLSAPSLDSQTKNSLLDQKNTAEKNLQWRGLLPLTEKVGDALNIALAQLEEANAAMLDGVLSNTNFNVLNTKAEKILSDKILSDMIRAFNAITFTDDNFEFPDLLGAAYEYLIKYFAESAGKKGGEFYTPARVVELMGKILQPEPDAEICDPTVGSGGLLISMHNYVESRYGSARNLTLHGQELKDGTYKMCRMNMLFHGIKNADIQQGDTLLNPRLLQNGQLRKYDIVVANPPFSQNYTQTGMHFTERFRYWMSTKKQADFMFVQHMIAVLKNSGRMAVVMPHGVLFRGGSEQSMRQELINSGILECVIGLPPSLFYGTGIPASILIINKADSEHRQGVFFINADREFQEGKNQNILRPEDIEKISYVYTHKIELPKYSRMVSKAELEAEDYNCNIRRYVDNAPDPEHHDVQAHLKGGIPNSEIEAFKPLFAPYLNITSLFFKNLREGYCRFADTVTSKENIRDILLNAESVKKTKKEYAARIAEFWQSALPELTALPINKNLYSLCSSLSEKFAAQLAKQPHPVLDEFQTRGAFAQYLSELKTNFKSVAASAWTPELIPEEELLQNQSAEVLERLHSLESRQNELQARFDEVESLEEGSWNPEEYQIIPKDQLKELRAEIKRNKGDLSRLKKDLNNCAKRIKAYQKTLDSKKSNEQEKAEAVSMLLKLESEKNNIAKTYARLETDKSGLESRIQAHTDLEEELKSCRTDIRELTRNKNLLVDQARERISSDTAKNLILARWHTLLENTVLTYVDAHIRTLQQNLERVYEKYTVPLSQILAARDSAAQKLNDFLQELGYDE